MSSLDERVAEFLPWARHFARSCASRLPGHLDREDLQSAGVLGYLTAAARYDVKKGASFQGYCAVRIRGAVLDELRRWDWAPRSVHRNHRRITRVTIALVEQLEREPTDAELAAALNMEVTELAVFQALSSPRRVVSLDETDSSHGEENLPLGERLPDPQAVAPDTEVVDAEARRTLLLCLAKLSKTHASVVVLHYLQEVPLRDIAAMMKVTPSRVSQLHHEALARMRQSWSRSERENGSATFE